MVEVSLEKVRTDEFLSQLVRLAANEGHLQPCEDGYQELRHPIWIKVRVGVTGFHLAQRARDDQQSMRIASHEPKPIDEGRAINRAGVNQIRKILSLDDTHLLQARDGVIPQWQGPPLARGSPQNSENKERGSKKLSGDEDSNAVLFPRPLLLLEDATKSE
jgi:hypothetical protein